jgi:hypothetical protein
VRYGLDTTVATGPVAESTTRSTPGPIGGVRILRTNYYPVLLLGPLGASLGSCSRGFHRQNL